MTEEQEKQLAILLYRYAAIVEVTPKSSLRRTIARMAVFNFVKGVAK